MILQYVYCVLIGVDKLLSCTNTIFTWQEQSVVFVFLGLEWVSLISLFNDNMNLSELFDAKRHFSWAC